ncbi:ATP-binding protein [Desulfococcaceae bacterium HSG8]|nr:ATP-binding protein [Desulfococcaceae bacterium HSG8]
MQLKMRYKINGTILITFVFIAVVFIAVHLPFQQRRFQTVMGKVETLLQTLVERDRKPLANEIFEGRVRPIKIRLQQMRKVEGILSIGIFDESGNLLVSDGTLPFPSKLPEAKQEIIAQGIQARKKVWHGQSVFFHAEEIQVIGERIGFIQLYYSLADVDKEQHLSFVLSGGLLFSILGIMLVLLNLILSETIIRPITYLRDAMQHIRSGELGGQVHIENKDEIGDLSITFNEMSADLADSYQKLSDSYKEIESRNAELSKAIVEREHAEKAVQKLNKELEDRVEKRTAELASAGDEIRSLNDQLNAELIRSEKMATLGQLIAGVAHEIKGPLGAIRASADNVSNSLLQILEQLPGLLRLLSEDLQKDFLDLIGKSMQRDAILSAREERKLKRKLIGTLEEYQVSDADEAADTLTDMGIYENPEPFLPLLRNPESHIILQNAYNFSGLQRGSQNISTAVDRAAKIVSALKTYAHYDHTETLVESDLTEGIETILTLYHNKLKYSIEVTRNYDELPMIMCYPDELNQVWTNLVHNAIQAMDGKGTLEVGIRRENDQAAITVTDSGKGIPDEIKERIFEPFFTTKPAGEGSGLGLDIVKKIIDKHQGKIEIESCPGKTSFRVLLPIHKEKLI